jgi:hypothetical protein
MAGGPALVPQAMTLDGGDRFNENGRPRGRP